MHQMAPVCDEWYFIHELTVASALLPVCGSNPFLSYNKEVGNCSSIPHRVGLMYEIWRSLKRNRMMEQSGLVP